MTNRELLSKAMPLSSLSENQWNELNKHAAEIERAGNTELSAALKTLQKNQARLEVMGNYFDYFGDVIDQPVREKSVNIR
jgi:hypothetical protein